MQLRTSYYILYSFEKVHSPPQCYVAMDR